MKSELKAYRKKPGVVQARQITGQPEDFPTPNGWVTANKGDWVLIDSDGKPYPYVDSVFQANYEPTETTRADQSSGELARRITRFGSRAADVAEEVSAAPSPKWFGNLHTLLEEVLAALPLPGAVDLNVQDVVAWVQKGIVSKADILKQVFGDGAVVIENAEQLAEAMLATALKTINMTRQQKAAAIYAKLQEMQDGTE